MALQFTIESPDFDRIRAGDNNAIEDAVRLLWFVANEEGRSRRADARKISARFSPAVLTLQPSANQNNLDMEGAGLIVFTGSTAVNITGFIAPSTDGAVLMILVTGSGTITIQHQHASSSAENRVVCQSGADVAVATNSSIILIYQGSRWRDLKLAS